MSDVMRQQYRELTAAEKKAMQKLKADAGELYDRLNGFGASREISLAKTKLEEAVMWATKHITGAGLPSPDDGGVNTQSGDNGPPPPPPKH